MHSSSNQESDKKGKNSGENVGKDESKDLDRQSNQQQPEQSRQAQSTPYWYPNGPGHAEPPQSGTEAFNERYRLILGIEERDFAPENKKT